MLRRDPLKTAAEIIAKRDWRRATKRTARRGSPQPVLIAEALYWSTDVQDAFGIQPVNFAEWKRNGLETFAAPAGDLVTGAGVIEYLKQHRRKNLIRRSATE